MLERLSEFQGYYEGQNTIGGIKYQLEFRMSIRENNEGDVGIMFEDALSGDIYSFFGGLRHKLPFSFICEQVYYKWSGQKMIFTCQTLQSHSEYEHDLFKNLAILEINGEFTGDQGTVLLREKGTSNEHKFKLVKKSDKVFRSLTINIAMVSPYEQSGITDVLPDVKKEYATAGIKIDALSAIIIDQSKNDWSAEEINNLLETQFPEVKDTTKWPDWKCYVLIISLYKDNKDAVGLVFDNRDPGNQGLALFLEHKKMKANHPDAQKNRTYAWIHEIGHILGLDHNFADRKMWMSEQLPDWNADQGISFGVYHTSMLRHIRTAVAIPGHRTGMATLLGKKKRSPKSSSLELTLKSYEVFHYAEPIEVEVRLRNCSKRRRSIAPCLYPEARLLKIQVRHQERGGWVDYQPSLHYIWNGDPVLLESNNHCDENAEPSGKDRLSQWINVANGYNGVPMFNPGKYVVRACYQYDKISVWSDEHAIEIRPAEVEYKNALNAQKRKYVKKFLFEYAKKAENGCQSFIKLILKKHPEERVRMRYRASLAKTTGDTRRVFSKSKDNKLVIRSKPGNLKNATDLLSEVKRYYERAGVELAEQKKENLSYRRYVEWNAAYLKEMGQENEALALLQALKTNLETRSVKPHALNSLPA